MLTLPRVRRLVNVSHWCIQFDLRRRNRPLFPSARPGGSHAAIGSWCVAGTSSCVQGALIAMVGVAAFGTGSVKMTLSPRLRCRVMSSLSRMLNRAGLEVTHLVDDRMNIEVMDMERPVLGLNGKMYPLLLRRAEDGGPDFVLDINEEVLVAAPDVNAISAGKGVAVILLFAIALVIGVLIGFLPKFLEHASELKLPLAMICLTVILGLAVSVNVFRAVRSGNRLEPVVFNRADQTVTRYSHAGAASYRWKALRPFIRIIQIVHAAGGSVTYQLILAEVDDETGVVRSEFVAGKGDLIGAGANRYGFIQCFMEGPLSSLPRFQLAALRMDWFKRLAVSIWTLEVTRKCLLGERDWTPLTMLLSVLWIALLAPFQVPELIGAWISKGPYGLKESGPWPGRFDALKSDSILKSKAEHYGEVTPVARRIIIISLALGAFAWVPLFLLLCIAVRG